MTRTDFSDGIAEDLAELVRGAAGAAPSHPGDLAAVQARGRTRRRHRGTAAAGLAALVVALVVAAPFALRSGPLPAAPPAVAPPAATSPAGGVAAAEPAQRLLVGSSGYWIGQDSDEALPDPGPMSLPEVYEWYQDQPGTYGVVGGLAEVQADGQLVELELPDLGALHQLVEAPDGRLAMLTAVDLMPGVDRPDGPCVEGMELRLVLVEPDGSTGLSRDVRVMCEHTRLLAVDQQVAYLLRDESRLVAHDLATGRELPLWDGGPVSGQAAYAGDRLVVVAEEPGCGPTTVQVAQVSDGPGTAGASVDHRLPWGSCTDWLGPVRLSPDGRYVALAHSRPGDAETDMQLWVSVLDLADGTVAADQLITQWPDPRSWLDTRPDRTASWHGEVDGLGWADDTTLRVAWYEVSGQGVQWLADVLQVATVRVR